MTSPTLAIESIDAPDAGGRRPTEAKARDAIEEFLGKELGACPEYRVIRDGDADSAASKCGWAFWILAEDTTSYVREDLTIEWYGTSWCAEGTPVP